MSGGANAWYFTSIAKLMAHYSELHFVELVAASFPRHFRGARVLEVGSLDINGSIRKYFVDCDYVGLDVAPGTGVDIVCEGQKFDAPDATYDVVISCEAMEHNPYWVATFKNMIRMCKPGGLVVMTCATTGRPEHGTTRTEPESSPLTVGLGWNYYRNLREKDFRSKVDLSVLPRHRFWTRWNHFDLLFVGIKNSVDAAPGPLTEQWTSAVRDIDNWMAEDSSARPLRYRAQVAGPLGDVWFVLMRRLASRVQRFASLLERLHMPHDRDRSNL